MAGDNRGSSSLFRRAEQIRRWQDSETNNQDYKNLTKHKKVTFSSGCIFLAASAAGDKDELIRLLQRGADINTVNQDGITALHAACIDNNLEIVEFLVDNGADVNQCDMEGWTPLHATASCGSLTMAKFLIDRGADLSIVNNDGELAVDVVDSEEMAKLLQKEMDARGIDRDAARSLEERRMLEDAQRWLNSNSYEDEAHPKTGATALHVAAAKGYTKVIRILLEAGANLETKDLDGWTALHAAVYWDQPEAVEILCDNLANMDTVNFVGQTPMDLANDEMRPLMEELCRKQKSLKLNKLNKNFNKKRKPSPEVERSKRREKENKVEPESSDEELSNDADHALESRVECPDETEIQSWRRPAALRHKQLPVDKSESICNAVVQERQTIKGPESEERTNAGGPLISKPRTISSTPKPLDNTLNNISTSPKSINSNNTTVTGGDGFLSKLHVNPPSVPPKLLSLSNPPLSPSIQQSELSPVAVPSSLEPQVQSTYKLSPGSVIMNFFKSFVPPSRDDESETQRKAHAKMVRSTRRSTQGVTLEEIKSAEQLMKSKQEISNNHEKVPSPVKETTSVLVAKPKIELSKAEEEDRRPSWRLKVDDNDKNRFSLEDVRSKKEASSPKPIDCETVTIQLRKKPESPKEEEKDGDRQLYSREGSQAAIQRRRKPKRRSTGVVQVDIDEIDPEKRTQKSLEESKVQSDESGSEPNDLGKESETATTRVSSQSTNALESSTSTPSNTSSEIDYKKNNTRLALAEADRREKRALERKLSEMEEELRQLQKLKAENEKLKAENRALTRVVSKLTNSAASAMSSLANLSK